MIIRPEEWISPPDKPDENGCCFLKAWVGSGNTEFPILIETYKVSLEDVTLHRDQDFELILECTKKPDVYQDEEAFLTSNEHSHMAPESVIPIGLFSFPYDPRIILNGTVVKTYKSPAEFGFGEDDVLFSVSCLGNEYDAVYHADYEGISIKEGNIVSCVYWVHGWPREDR